MRQHMLSAAVLLSGALAARASSDNNLGQAVWVESTTSGQILNHTWWGTSGMNYLVRVSTDLATWTFLPDFNPAGADATLGVEIPIETPRIFSRVYQFDPNSVSTALDTDNDGLPDLWEQYHFGNLDRNGTLNFDNDGLTDLEEFQFGMNPKTNETASTAFTFAYDDIGRLTGVSGNATSVSFTLDAEGNVTASD